MLQWLQGRVKEDFRLHAVHSYVHLAHAGIMAINSIRIWTLRNSTIAGTWGQRLLCCQDCPQKTHKPDSQGRSLPVETSMLPLVYPTHTAEYEGRGKHLC